MMLTPDAVRSTVNGMTNFTTTLRQQQTIRFETDVDFTIKHGYGRQRKTTWKISHVVFIFTRFRTAGEGWQRWVLDGHVTSANVKADGALGERSLDDLARRVATSRGKLDERWQPHLTELLAEAEAVRDAAVWAD